MPASASEPSSGSAASPASPGPLERRSFKVIKLDTPKGRDFLTDLARGVDRLHSRLDTLFQHLGIEE